MLSLLALLGAFSGAFLSLWSKQLLTPGCFLIAAGLSVLPLWRFRSWLPIAVMLCSFSLSAAWAVHNGEQRLRALWPETLWREPVRAELVVRSIPHFDQRTGLWRFDAELLRYHCLRRACHREGGGLIRLHWYAPDRQLRSGQIWRLVLRLKRPRSLMNDGGFDYRRYALSQGITAIGGVSRGHEAFLLGEQAGLIGGYRVWRQGVADALFQRWTEHSMRGFLLALTLGERRDIDPRDWRLMQSTGVVHLMAISGLHIGMAAAAGWLLLSRLLSPLPMARWLALAGSAMIAMVYAALAGFTLPTQRALIMVLAILGSNMLNRRLSAWHGWRWGCWILLLTDPLVVLETGFYLSFLAVAVLLCYSSGRRQSRIRSYFGPQLAIGLALMPLTVVMNGAFNTLSLPANLILIPLFGALVVPPLLMALLMLAPAKFAGAWSLPVADILVGAVDAILRRCLTVLGDVQSMSLLPSLDVAANAYALMLLALAGVIGLLPLPSGGRWLSAVLMLIALQIKADKPAPDEVWVTVLDVGQGTSVLMQSAQANWVYDLGRSGSARFNSSEHNLLPLLRQRGIEVLDGLVISHADNDHYGAYKAFLERMPVREIWLGEALPGLSAKQQVHSGRGLALPRVKYCRPGLSSTAGPWQLSVLHPADDGWQGNNASCVLRLQFGEGARWLLPGDIERKAELALIQTGVALASDVVLAPHHGSRTSSSADFVEAVGADEVLVTAAYRHHFGHPHPTVVDRWQAAGAKVLNVAHCGALEWRYRSGVLQKRIRWREQKARWWHDGHCE